MSLFYCFFIILLSLTTSTTTPLSILAHCAHFQSISNAFHSLREVYIVACFLASNVISCQMLATHSKPYFHRPQNRYTYSFASTPPFRYRGCVPSVANLRCVSTRWLRVESFQIGLQVGYGMPPHQFHAPYCRALDTN